MTHHKNVCTETNPFVFNWTLEPISMCACKPGQTIESPVFVVDMLGKSRWSLLLEPKGDVSRDTIQCTLMRAKEDGYPGDITIKFKVLIASDVVSDCYTFKPGDSYDCLATTSLKNLFINKSKYIRNDVFSIRCYIWIPDTEILKDSRVAKQSVARILSTLIPEFKPGKNSSLLRAADEKLKSVMRYPDPSQLHVRTRFELERRSIFFNIDIPKMQGKEPFSFIIPSTGIDSPSLILTVRLTGDFNETIKSCLHARFKIRSSSSQTQMFVKCKIKMNENTGNDFSVEDQHLFLGNEKDDAWHFFPAIKGKKLLEDTYQFAKNNVLDLHCEFTISYNGKISHTLGDIGFSSCLKRSCDTKPSSDVTKRIKLYNDKKFCDVKLTAGGKSFMAHKSILCSESPVFNAMFENEMKEKTTDEVEILDVDPETVKRLLKFLYTGVLDLSDMTEENIMSLYYASDKYQITELQKHCSDFLISKISANNICEILSLANRHEDLCLKKAALDFICNDAKTIFASGEWEDLMTYNLKLAADTMRHMLVNTE